jgi:chromosome segregation ATPase
MADAEQLRRQAKHIGTLHEAGERIRALTARAEAAEAQAEELRTKLDDLARSARTDLEAAEARAVRAEGLAADREAELRVAASEFHELRAQRDRVVEAWDNALDELVDVWHQREDHRPLHEFLEMTWEQYGTWVRDPKAALLAMLDHTQDSEDRG